MATQADVRPIALSLPATEEAADRFAFAVRAGAKAKGYAWVWQERVDPERPRVPCPGVLAVRVSCDAEKQALLALDEARFFTEPHYDGFPAVLVRLARVDRAELRRLLTNAWRCQAPRALLAPAAAPPERKRTRAKRRA
jgi:hypothetical protein